MDEANKTLQTDAFTFFIKDYDEKKMLYTLENPITKETIQMEAHTKKSPRKNQGP